MPKAVKLAKEKDRGKGKRNNISTILDNIIPSIFEGCYFHYDTLSQKQQKKVSQREQN